MHCISAKFVLRLLSNGQKENHVNISQELLDCPSADENFIKKIMTGDEMWVYGYDIETVLQSSSQ